MHPSVVVDTSVWASRLMPQDVNHTASQTWSNRYLAGGGIIVVPEFMLVELAATLTRQTQQPITAKQTARSLYNSIINIQPTSTELAQLAIDVAADLRLRGGDAIFVALAQQLSLPLVSWDQQQLQRAAPLVETYSPDDYPF